METLKHFEAYSRDINGAEMPLDVHSAELAISRHQNIYTIIRSFSIESVESALQELRKRVFSPQRNKNGLSKNGTVITNPDLVSLINCR